MKIFNKFIWSKKEPSNKNDIWFDGSTWKMYTEEAWQSFTLPIDAADKVAKVLENASEVYQEKLNAGYGIIIEGNTISVDDSILYDDSGVWEAIETLQQNKVEQIQLNDYVPLDRYTSTSQVLMDNISELNSIKLNKTDVATINGQSLAEGGNIVIDENSKIILDFEKLGEPIEFDEEGMEMRYSKEQFENSVGMSMSEFIEKIKTSELVFLVGGGSTTSYHTIADEYTWAGYYKMVGFCTYVLFVDTTPSEEKFFVAAYDESVDLPFATTEYVDEKHAQTETKLAELSAEVNEVAEKIDNINPTPMISVTYAELVALRDNGGLVAGMQYRITDYVTTTAQKNTRSAGHPFDVIVTADNENTLNEVARACRSEFDIEKYKDAFSGTWTEKMLYVGTQEYEGKEYHLYESESRDLQMLMDFSRQLEINFEVHDNYPFVYYPHYTRILNDSNWDTWQDGREFAEVIQFKYEDPSYFDSCKLEAWQIWYSLDNDTERFAWALNDGDIYADCFDDGNRLPNDVQDCVIKVIPHEEEYYIDNQKVMYLYDCKDGAQVFLAADQTIYNETENPIGYYNVIKGKGVIYRMIDEWNNDCPYDFKNIQFKRFAVTEYDKVPSLVVDNKDNYYGYYYGALDLFGYQAIEEATYGKDFVWVYTFALKDFATEIWHDYTILNSIGLGTEESGIITCHSNVIKEHRDEYLGEHGRKAIWLNNIVFFNCYDDISSPYYSECYSYCHSNSFGNGCHSNSFGIDCYFNSFDNNCYSNSFGNGCLMNSFGKTCYSNSFDNNCDYNSFGIYCYSNSFGSMCKYNSFGNGCYDIKLSKNTRYKTASVNSNNKVEVYNIVDLLV